MSKTYEHLTQEEVDFFMENGYLVVKQAFTRAKAEAFTKDMWIRLGVDPHDPSTWDRERVHMPALRREPVATFAPKAWEAMKALLGGEERIDASTSAWGDSFIVNFGPPSANGSQAPPPPLSASNPARPALVAHPDAPQELNNWHVDGDFFVHFLDSPEQALLVVPLFSDIKPGGGGTWVAPEGIDAVAKYLAKHPEGVVAASLCFVPSTSRFARPGESLSVTEVEAARKEEGEGFYGHLEEVRKCGRFVELTGEVGDVVLMHPLMVHSAARNCLRGVPRVITNPPVALREPFCFAREREEEYSLVERKTLRALGVDRYEFMPTTERKSVVPPRVHREAVVREEERKRIEEARRKVESEAMGPSVVGVA